MSTLTMAGLITFPAVRERQEIKIRRISSVRIESSWKDFTSYADIKLPRKIKNFSKEKFEEIFKVGDPVIIRLGYGCDEDYSNNTLPTEFTGYITCVSVGVPVEIRCENEMYKLKLGEISVSKAQITLKELLKIIAPNYEIECPDMKLGAVRYPNVAPINILSGLKKEAGLYFYFIDKVLHVADGYVEKELDNKGVVNILLEKNAVSENLNTKNAETAFVVKIISNRGMKEKPLKCSYGEAGGGKFETTCYGLSQKEIEIRAKRLYAIHKTKRLEGEITLFGIPRVQHSMKINLISNFYENMNGMYYIEKVIKTFDEGGYRQIVSLGNKAM